MPRLQGSIPCGVGQRICDRLTDGHPPSLTRLAPGPPPGAALLAMALRPILKMTTVDSSGGGSTEHWLCDPVEGPGRYASPSGNWIPGLDGSSLPRAVERAIQGRQPARPSPGQGGSVRLLHRVGNANPLSFLAGRLYLDREMVAGYIGTDPQGTEWTPSAPLIVAKGLAAGSAKGGNATARPDSSTEYVTTTEVHIRPRSKLFERSVPNRRLLGYPSGLLGHDLASCVGTTSYSTLHTKYGFQAYVLMPLVWPVGATDRMHLVGNSEVAFWVKRHSDGYSWRLLTAYNTAGGVVEIDGPIYQPDEDYHMLHMDFDTAPGGGGVAARWWVDGTLTSATSATAFATTAGNMQMMRFKSDSTKRCGTIVGAVAVFSALFTDEVISRAVADRLPRDEPNMVLYCPGPALISGTATSASLDAAAAVNKGGGQVGIPITAHPFAAADYLRFDGSTNYDGHWPVISQTTNEIVIAPDGGYVAETFAGTETAEQQEGTLHDQAAANASAPFDCAFTNCAVGPLLEGYEQHAGTILPRIYLAQHMRPTFVDAPNRTARFSDLRQVEKVSFLGDLGDAITRDEYYSLIGWARAVPAAGSAAVTPWGGGAVKLGSNLADNDRLAGDVLGSSGWPYSLALGTNQNDARVEFPVATNPGGNDFVYELVFRWDGATTGQTNVFLSEWCQVLNNIFTARPANKFSAIVAHTGGAMLVEFDVQALATTTLRIEAWETVSPNRTHMSVYVNGELVGSDDTTTSSQLVATFATSPTLSTSVPTANFADLGALPMRLWGPNAVGADPKKFLFRHPVNGTDAEYADLIGLWYRPDPTDPVKVQDEISTNDGTITNPLPGGNWQPGLCWSSPKMAAMMTLRDWGQVAESAITIQSAAWSGIPEEPQALWVREPQTIAEAAATAIGPGFAMIRADETIAVGAMVAATAGNSSGTLTADQVKALGDEVLSAGEGTGALPPTTAAMAWGHVADPQAPDSTVDADRAAIMSRSAGHAVQTLPVGTNAAKYNDDPYPDGRTYTLPGQYRDNGPTRTALAAAATTYEAERPERSMVVAPGFSAPVAGEVWGVTDPRDASVTYVTVQSTSRGREADEMDTRIE